VEVGSGAPTSFCLGWVGVATRLIGFGGCVLVGPAPAGSRWQVWIPSFFGENERGSFPAWGWPPALVLLFTKSKNSRSPRISDASRNSVFVTFLSF
jgi:hypothetical protein